MELRPDQVARLRLDRHAMSNAQAVAHRAAVEASTPFAKALAKALTSQEQADQMLAADQDRRGVNRPWANRS